jgi:putative molybdopterin biosynthesis protein
VVDNPRRIASKLRTVPEIETTLGELRRKRGLSAIRLASAAGVTRQTIYAIEAGTYVPNTAVALRLARALDTTVEQLFALPRPAAPPTPRIAQATLLPGWPGAKQGQAVQLCRVNRRLMASPPSLAPWYFPATDAVVTGQPARKGKVQVQPFEDDDRLTDRLLVAGCDPGLSVLSRHVRSTGIELVLAHRNSSQALALLKECCRSSESVVF